MIRLNPLNRHIQMPGQRHLRLTHRGQKLLEEHFAGVGRDTTIRLDGLLKRSALECYSMVSAVAAGWSDCPP